MADVAGFAEWMSFLESRHLADLTFPEVSRALRALSSAYVERRGKLPEGAALAGAGKRAAFGLFYGPLHFLLVRHIVDSVPELTRGMGEIVDLGCGTGAAGVAWATACAQGVAVHGVDRHPWAVEEARETYRVFGLRNRTRVEDVGKVALPDRSAVVAAFAINELNAATRDRLLSRLISHAEQGGCVLIVEPLAGFVAPWWATWQRAFQSSGGRANEWRTRAALPAIVEKLDRAAGLNHRELTGRSLLLQLRG
jgi:SAM-dependent methyltransferase